MEEKDLSSSPKQLILELSNDIWKNCTCDTNSATGHESYLADQPIFHNLVGRLICIKSQFFQKGQFININSILRCQFNPSDNTMHA
ncbi:Uncharacterised protein [Achromobacter xylosoxidans]|nr:Uncharacterised protein [Achromobacter xylosoxidans]